MVEYYESYAAYSRVLERKRKNSDKMVASIVMKRVLKLADSDKGLKESCKVGFF